MSYESDSPADRLAAVRAAIGRCLNSQDYTIGGRRQTMAQLKDLRAMEKELMDEVGQAANGGSMGELGMLVDPQ